MGQLVTDSRFLTANPYSFRVRSTGPKGSLPFFKEKPWTMLRPRPKRVPGYSWRSCARLPAASGPIPYHPSL